MTTRSYEIRNTASGHVLGLYRGESAADAIAAMNLDAGNSPRYTLVDSKGRSDVFGLARHEVVFASEAEAEAAASSLRSTCDWNDISVVEYDDPEIVATEAVELRVFCDEHEASDDGWANDAWYTLTRAGIDPEEPADGGNGWEAQSGVSDGEEYVFVRVGPSGVSDGEEYVFVRVGPSSVDAAVEALEAEGFRVEVAGR